MVQNREVKFQGEKAYHDSNIWDSNICGFLCLILHYLGGSEQITSLTCLLSEWK